MAAVELFSEANFGGKLLCSDFDVADVCTKNFNSKTCSIKVKSGRWCFCTEAHLKGHCVELDPGEYPNVQDVGIPNHQISSFKQIG